MVERTFNGDGQLIRTVTETTGSEGDISTSDAEFAYTDSYPRFEAQLVRRYYDHQVTGLVGSGLVRLREPGLDPRGGYIVVNGIDRTTESGTSFIARYSLLSLVHSFFGSGLPSTPNRIRQLPRIQILSPTLITELDDPAAIEVRWRTEWARWDGRWIHFGAFLDGRFVDPDIADIALTAAAEAEAASAPARADAAWQLAEVQLAALGRDAKLDRVRAERAAAAARRG